MEYKKAILIVLLFLGVWWLRPLGLFHALAIGLYIYSPVLIPATIVSTIAGVYAFRKSIFTRTKDRIEEGLATFITTWFIMVFITGITLGVYGGAAMYTEMYHSLQYNKGNSIPQMDNSTIRAVPMVVAESLMNKYFTEPRYYPDGAQITEINGTLVWAGQLTPDGFINHFRLEPSGVIYVPMDSMNVVTIKKNMKCGYDIGVTDNIIWTLRKHKYWVNYGDPIPVIENGTIYYIVPYTAYRFHLTHVTPYWGGVAVVNTRTCDVKYLNPEEAAKKYGSLPIIPEKLAKMYVEAMNYYMDSPLDNFMNVHFKHMNQIEVHDYNVSKNGQPFFVKLADGEGAWFIAAEPYGTGSGIKRIAVITMDGKIYYRDFETPITGVDAAVSAIKNSLPRFDWSQFDIVEPIPMEINGQLYWRFIIVPKGASTIRMIALVPMKSEAVQPGDIKFFNSIEEFREYLTGKTVINPTTHPTPTGKDINGTVKAVYTYTLNGTTHFLLEVAAGNNTKIVDFPVNCLTTEQIAEMFSIKPGENITLKWNGKCFAPRG